MQSPRLAAVDRSGDLLCSQFMVVLDVAIVNVASSQIRASLGLSIASEQ
jgi:acetolactate synthase regulatory subunit